MKIRKAAKNDVGLISEIYDRIIDADIAPDSRVGWTKGVYPTAETAEEALCRGDLFVCEDEGKIIAAAIINKVQADAYAYCRWELDAEPDEVMVLHTLVVDPAEKGRGAGRFFVAYYEGLASETGCKVLRMDTNVKNTRARRLYKSLGYREAGVVPCVFNGIPDVDLVCLEKRV